MSDLKTGHELARIYGVKDFELFGYVKRGLQLLSQTGQPILPPGVKEQKSKLVNLEYKKAHIKQRLATLKDLPEDSVDPTVNLRRYGPNSLNSV